MIRLVLWVVTATRVVLVPVFLVVALRAQELARAGTDFGMHRWAVVGLLSVIGLSDVVDGWLARRFDLATQAGAVVDALADKLVQIALAVFFAFSRGPAFAPLPLWFLGLVVCRDLVLGGGWLALRARRLPIHVVHRPHGRVASVSVFAVLFWLTSGMPREGVGALLLLSSLLIVASTIAYTLDGLRQVRERTHHNPTREDA